MAIPTSLPDYITRDQTCCFTGHRIISMRLREDVVAAVDRRIKNLYDAGYRYFIAGGAIGFDMLAETEILRAMRFAEDLRLILALPCRNHTIKWERLPNHVELLRKHQQILGRANYVIYVTDFYTETCMQERNRFMVDHSSACIAYYSGAGRSGAGQTYRMAVADGLDVYNVWEDMEHEEK